MQRKIRQFTLICLAQNRILIPKISMLVRRSAVRGRANAKWISYREACLRQRGGIDRMSWIDEGTRRVAGEGDGFVPAVGNR